jgi:hypothetical protein
MNDILTMYNVACYTHGIPRYVTKYRRYHTSVDVDTLGREESSDDIQPFPAAIRADENERAEKSFLPLRTLMDVDPAMTVLRCSNSHSFLS